MKNEENAADRASRQVANKAEVDLSGLTRYDISEGGTLHESADGVFVNFGEVEDLLVTPPATTGASTAQRPTDDDLWDATLRDRDAYHEWADKLADAIANHFGVDIGEHSNQNLPWDEALQAIENAEPVGASTVLTDQRKLRDFIVNWSAALYPNPDELMAAIKANIGTPVAAQAGQVAEKDRLLKALERAAIAESALRRLADEVENDAVPGWEDRLMACIAEANSILNGSGAGQVAVPQDVLRVVRRLLDGSQPQDVPGALMVIDTALAGGAA